MTARRRADSHKSRTADFLSPLRFTPWMERAVQPLVKPGPRLKGLHQGYRRWAPFEGMKMNLACGDDIRPAKEGWVNVDRIAGPDVRQIDLFKFPWPFDDKSFDYILSSHFFEHIPHTVLGYERDGFLMILSECFRVLKPEGHLEIVVPHPRNPYYWEDPTHCRMILRSTWTMLEENRAYHSSDLFHLKRAETVRSPNRWLADITLLGKNLFLFVAEVPIARLAFRPMYSRFLLERQREEDQRVAVTASAPPGWRGPAR